jgi:4-hydroxybenzoate polyprenyltransferase
MTRVATAFLLCLRESRPVVQVMYLLRFTAGASLAFAFGGAVLTGRVVIAALAWLATNIATYLYNGVADLEEDRLNGSQRPVVRGEVSVGQALGTVLCLAMIALLLGITVGGAVAGLVLVSLLLGYSYSSPPLRLKRHVPGQFLTGTGLSLLSYLAGYVSMVGVFPPRRESVIFALALSLWTGMVGQTKDLPDLEGDRAAGRRTLPCLLGERRARFVLAGIALTLGAGFVVVSTLWASKLWLPAMFLLVGAGAVTVALGRYGGDRDRRREPYRLFMVTQYLACVSVVITTLAID